MRINCTSRRAVRHLRAHVATLRSRICNAESAPVFSRLWDMLARRCLYLESLAITGTAPSVSDAFPPHRTRWPCLRRLTIDDAVLGDYGPPGHPSFHSFVDFLAQHPTLQSLYIVGDSGFHHTQLARLEEEALPSLTEFTGSLDHLRSLLSRSLGPGGANMNLNAQVLWGAQWGQGDSVSDTSLAKTLQRVCFPEPMQLRELTPLSISRVLSDLTALTSLTITFVLHSGYDSNSVFRTIVASCPQLLHLDLACTSKPSFYLVRPSVWKHPPELMLFTFQDTFARAVKKLGRLRTLDLSIVRFHGEEAMHLGAARIALANSRLERFTINYIPAHPPHPHRRTRPHPLETGVFELLCDVHGLPVSLYVAEWRRALAGGGGGGVVWRGVVSAGMLLGIGFGTGWRRSRSGWTRRWMYELRPSGHPDAVRKSLGELLLERSQAGEEARLLALCFGLLLLAMWGVLWRAATYVPRVLWIL